MCITKTTPFEAAFAFLEKPENFSKRKLVLLKNSFRSLLDDLLSCFLSTQTEGQTEGECATSEDCSKDRLDDARSNTKSVESCRNSEDPDSPLRNTTSEFCYVEMTCTCTCDNNFLH